MAFQPIQTDVYDRRTHLSSGLGKLHEEFHHWDGTLQIVHDDTDHAAHFYGEHDRVGLWSLHGSLAENRALLRSAHNIFNNSMLEEVRTVAETVLEETKFTITAERVGEFARQMAALLRAGGGVGAFLAIMMRVIGKTGMPRAAVAAEVGGKGKPAQHVEIDAAAYQLLFSENPENRSIWWLMNAVIAKSSIEQDSRLEHATGVEFRLAREYVASLGDGDVKARLLARIERLEKDDEPVEFPDIGLGD